MADPLFILQRPFTTVSTLFFASFPVDSSPKLRRGASLRLFSVRNDHTSPPVVVSTTEYSDGSVLFRFGDASEMANEKVVEEEEENNYRVVGSNNSVGGDRRALGSDKLSRDNVGVVDGRGTSEHCDSGKDMITTYELESKLKAENTKNEDIPPSVAPLDDVGDASNVIVEIPESRLDVTVESSGKIDDTVPSSNSLEEIIEGDANSSSTKADVSILNATELLTTRADVSREEEGFTATLFLFSGASSLPHPSKVVRILTLLLTIIGLGLLMELVNGRLKGLMLAYTPMS